MMDKDKSHHGRFSTSSPPNNSYNLIPSQPGAFNLPPLGTDSSSEQGRFGRGLCQMPDNPPENMGHRHAHFDSGLSVVGGFDGPSFSDGNEDFLSMYLDMDKFNSNSATSGNQVGGESSSLLAAEPCSTSAYPFALANQIAGNMGGALCENPRIMHQHSQSMDGSTTTKPETHMSDPKKAKSAARLAELALTDPIQHRRVLANRLSAARSKDRKMRYIAELERKVQTLQTDASSLSAQLALLQARAYERGVRYIVELERKVQTLQTEDSSLSAQLTLLQRDTNALASENSELKLRFQGMELRIGLQDELIDALNEEIQRLKVGTGQTTADSGAMMDFPASYGSNQKQYHSDNQTMQAPLTTQPLQQLQIHSQQFQQQEQQQQDHGPNASSFFK